MKTFVVLNGSQSGPFTTEEMSGLFGSGRVTAETLGWQDGMAEWQPLGKWYSPAGNRSGDVTTPLVHSPRPQVEAAAVPHYSLLAKLSFYLGAFGCCVWLACMVGLLAAAETAKEVGGEMSDRDALFYGLICLGIMLENLLGLTLGVVAFRQPQPARKLPLAGICLNALPLLVFGTLLVIGVLVDKTPAR